MKIKPFAFIAVISTAILISACSSDQSPSELDVLIDSLQTSQLVSDSPEEEASVSDETDSEDTDIDSNDSSTDKCAYDSVTGTVFNITDGYIFIKSGEKEYNIVVNEDTQFFGDDVEIGKIVTVTYAADDEESEKINAAAVTIIPSSVTSSDN